MGKVRTAVNTLYIARRMKTEVSPSVILSLFTILPQDKEQWIEATNLPIDDYEDALQASCALMNDCYIAISRDHHFDCAPMVVMTPEHFISVVSE